MREDFVELDENAAKHKRLPEGREESFNGTRISVFKEFAEKEPHNTIFLPVNSEEPTLTNVRVKNFLIGTISNVFGMTDEFAMTSNVIEDNFLYQLRAN
jgi:hypothetical protein